jgi:hypothetical protein
MQSLSAEHSSQHTIGVQRAGVAMGNHALRVLNALIPAERDLDRLVVPHARPMPVPCRRCCPACGARPTIISRGTCRDFHLGEMPLRP